MRTIANNTDGSIIIDAKIDRSQIPAEFAELQKQIQQELEKLQKTVDDLATNFDALSKSTKGIENGLSGIKDEVEGVGKGFKESEEKATGFRKKTTDAVTQVANTMQSMQIQELVSEITDAFVECAAASIEFESAMTGVFKTINGTDEQLKTIEQGIRDMSTELPSSASEIAAVAEAAGQLGVTTEGILDFTETMINLGEATNLTADEAASSLAKFANVTGMLEADYSRLGSVVVALGNTMATTEADIVAMGTRIASAGEQVGLTEDQIMGMAAALSSVGLEAEAGGTAISKLMTDMKSSASMADETAEMLSKTGMSVRELEMLADTSSTEFKALANELGYTSTELKNLVKQRGQLEKFAEIAGMTADQFVDAFGKDAAKTMATFFEGLGNGSEDAITILNELGIEEVRLRDTMLRLTSASDLFAQAQSTAASAWEDNIALAEEAEKRYETTESKIAMLGNAFNDLKISVGDVFSDTINNAVEWLTDITLAASEFVQENPEIVKALGLFAGAIAGIGIAAAGAMAITSLISALSGMGPLIGIVSGVGAAIGILVTAVAGIAFDNEVESVRELTTALRDAKDGFAEADKVFLESIAEIKATTTVAEKYVEKLEALEKAGLGSAEAQSEYAATIASLNKLMPELNLTIDETTGKIQGGTDAIRDQIAAWKEAAEAQAYYQMYQQKLSLKLEAEIELATNKDKLAEIQAELDKIISQNPAQSFANPKPFNFNLTGVVSGEQNKQVDVYRQQIEELMAAISQGESTVAQFDAGLATLESSMSGVKAETGTFTAETQEMAVGVFESTAEMHASLEGMIPATIELGVAMGETAGQAQALNNSVGNTQIYDSAIAAIKNLAAAYESTLSEALTQVESQFSIIADLPQKLDTSFEEITKKLEAQTQYWEDYRKGLETLEAAGLSEEILGELASGSEESVSIVSALIEEIENLGGVDTAAVQSRIDEINGAFANLKTAEETVAQEMAAIQTQFDENLALILESCGTKGTESGTALIESLKTAISESGEGISESAIAAITTGLGLASEGANTSANSVGANIVAGITSGVYSGSGDLIAAMANIVNAAIQAAKDAAEIHSPSQRARDEIGEPLSEGVAVGIVAGSQEIADAARITADEALDALGESIKESKLADQIVSIFGEEGNILGEALEHVLDQFELLGRTLVQCFIFGFEEMLPEFRLKTQLFFEEMILLLNSRTVDITRQAYSTLYNTIQEFYPQLFGTIMYMVEKVPELIDQLSNETTLIVAGATNMLLAIINTIYNYGDMLAEAGAFITEKLIEGFRHNEEEVRKFIQWAILLLLEIVSNDKSQELFMQAIGILLNAARQAVERHAENLNEAGSLIIQHITDGIKAQLEEDDGGGKTEFLAMVGAVAAAAAAAVDEYAEGFEAAGKMIPQYIASGILSGTDEAIDAINSMMEQLASAAAAGAARIKTEVALAYEEAAKATAEQAQGVVAGGSAYNVTNNNSTTYNVNYSFSSSQLDEAAATNLTNTASQRIAMGII